jgi:phosphoenolpyruvate carboxykinase (GTP)
MRIPNPPLIFLVNWFRQDEQGKFLWPGFGENLRVLEWVLQRRREEVAAVQTPIGYLPNEGALDMTGLDIPREQMEQLFAVDQQGWLKECDEVKAFFNSLGERMPQRLYDELELLRYRLRRCCGPQGRFHMVW